MSHNLTHSKPETLTCSCTFISGCANSVSTLTCLFLAKTNSDLNTISFAISHSSQPSFVLVLIGLPSDVDRVMALPSSFFAM